MRCKKVRKDYHQPCGLAIRAERIVTLATIVGVCVARRRKDDNVHSGLRSAHVRNTPSVWTSRQAEILRDAVRKRANYFHAVTNRMQRLGVGPGDPLYDLFKQAEDSTSRLVLALHDKTHHSLRPLGE
jgi:hypothetical protein